MAIFGESLITTKLNHRHLNRTRVLLGVNKGLNHMMEEYNRATFFCPPIKRVHVVIAIGAHPSLHLNLHQPYSALFGLIIAAKSYTF